MSYNIIIDDSYSGHGNTSVGSGANSTTGVGAPTSFNSPSIGGAWFDLVGNNFYTNSGALKSDNSFGGVTDLLYRPAVENFKDGYVRQYSNGNWACTLVGRLSPTGSTSYYGVSFGMNSINIFKVVAGVGTVLVPSIYDNTYPVDLDPYVAQASGKPYIFQFEIRSNNSSTSTLIATFYDYLDTGCTTPLATFCVTDNEASLQVSGSWGYRLTGSEPTVQVTRMQTASLNSSSLVAPTIGETNVLRTTIDMTALPAAGGSGTYTYQYYSSTVFGTKGTALSGKTALAFTGFAVTPGASIYLTLDANDGSTTVSSQQVQVKPYHFIFGVLGDSITAGFYGQHMALDVIQALRDYGYKVGEYTIGVPGSSTASWQKTYVPPFGGFDKNPNNYVYTAIRLNNLQVNFVSFMLGTNDCDGSSGYISQAQYQANWLQMMSDFRADVASLQQFFLHFPPYPQVGWGNNALFLTYQTVLTNIGNGYLSLPGDLSSAYNSFKDNALNHGGSLYYTDAGTGSGSFDVTGGSTGGGNTISAVTVAGVNIINTTIAWTTSNANTASLVAAAINSYTSSPDYSAVAYGATVVVTSGDTSGAINGTAIVVTVNGTVTVGNQQVFLGSGVDPVHPNDNGGILIASVQSLAISNWLYQHIIATDSFAGTAGTMLTAHVDPAGNTWSIQDGSAANLLLDGTGKVYNNATFQNSASYNVPLTKVPLRFEVEFLWNTGGSNNFPMVFVDESASSGNGTRWQYSYYTGLDGYAQWYEFVGGSAVSNPFVFAFNTSSLSDGDVVKIGIVLLENEVSWYTYLNGIVDISPTPMVYSNGLNKNLIAKFGFGFLGKSSDVTKGFRVQKITVWDPITYPITGALTLTSKTRTSVTLAVANPTNTNGTVTKKIQITTDAGLTFSDVSGATGSAPVITGLTAATSYTYRSISTDSADSSNPTYSPLLTVMTNATDIVAGTQSPGGVTNSTATWSFTAATGATGSVTNQGQISTDGVTYSDVGGATSSPYIATGLAAATLYYGRTKQTDSAAPGSPVYTNVVTQTTSAGGAPTTAPVVTEAYVSGIPTYTFTTPAGATAVTIQRVVGGVTTTITTSGSSPFQDLGYNGAPPSAYIFFGTNTSGAGPSTTVQMGSGGGNGIWWW